MPKSAVHTGVVNAAVDAARFVKVNVRVSAGVGVSVDGARDINVDGRYR
jgi:shikimate kinase